MFIYFRFAVHHRVLIKQKILFTHWERLSNGHHAVWSCDSSPKTRALSSRRIAKKKRAMTRHKSYSALPRILHRECDVFQDHDTQNQLITWRMTQNSTALCFRRNRGSTLIQYKLHSRAPFCIFMTTNDIKLISLCFRWNRCSTRSGECSRCAKATIASPSATSTLTTKDTCVEHSPTKVDVGTSGKP